MKRNIFVVVLSLVFGAMLFHSGVYAGVCIHTSVDRPVVLAGSDDEHIVVKVGLSGDDSSINLDRLPLNVSVVLDRSGSMRSNNKMEDAKRGAIEVVQRLNRNDIFSLVVYESVPRVILSAQQVTNKDAIIELIQGIHSGGSTALYGGVTMGADEVRKNLSDEYVNRIILLSDGLANVGPGSTSDLSELGQSLIKEGITVTTIGVGLDYNEDLMTVLANKSGGNSYFAGNSKELPKIFAEEIGEAMTLMAKRIRVFVDCPKGVSPVTILGREGNIYGQKMRSDIENLYGKNEKYILFEVKVPKHEDGKLIEAARVNVEYTDPYTRNSINETKKVTIKYNKNIDIVKNQENKKIIKASALTRTSEMKEEAIKLSDNGRYEEAAKLLKNRGVELEKVARECDNDKEILQEAFECQDSSNVIISNKGMSRLQRKSFKNDVSTQIGQQYYDPNRRN